MTQIKFASKVYSGSLILREFFAVLFFEFANSRTKINNHIINKPHFIYELCVIELITYCFATFQQLTLFFSLKTSALALGLGLQLG